MSVISQGKGGKYLENLKARPKSHNQVIHFLLIFRFMGENEYEVSEGDRRWTLTFPILTHSFIHGLDPQANPINRYTSDLTETNLLSPFTKIFYHKVWG